MQDLPAPVRSRDGQAGQRVQVMTVGGGPLMSVNAAAGRGTAGFRYNPAVLIQAPWFPVMLLWLKAFHIVFAVTWFAGLFYLPRLFVYHVDATDAVGRERFAVMERRLYGIMNIGAALTVIFAASMIVTAPAYMRMGWLHAKLTLVALLVVYHFLCGREMKALAAGRSQHSSRWYRIFNEAPALLLIGIVVLAVVKPF